MRMKRGERVSKCCLYCTLSRAKSVCLSLNEADAEDERCLESLLCNRATEAGRAPQGASVLRLQRAESGHSIQGPKPCTQFLAWPPSPPGNAVVH